MNDWLAMFIFLIVFCNLTGIIININYIYKDNDGTLLYQVWSNNMNLFGKLLLTFICLIFFPIWTILEALIRLLKWLCYVGKEKC